MAATLNGVLENNLAESIIKSRLLMVGAGGIGCELLKNLVLSGFSNIEVIDLDTIDVSNLNRQFLFRKEHVGKSKAQVAKESALKFKADANIVAHHESIFSPEFGLDFFKQFTLVLNALDNRAARNHVNRMCLAADIPLVESGTAGYLGQVTVIKKKLTECYECQPKPTQKTFPGCTIRNTPSEPVHCVVWAKHLFNQLFGEDDPDQDVSPDTEDPELAAEAGQAALSTEAKKDTIGGIERKSTRSWAMETGYDAEKLFNKLFRDDIKYLLSMENLWKKRRAPQPLDFQELPGKGEAMCTGVMRDQRVWSVQECADIFAQSLAALKQDLYSKGDGGTLVWDKDDHNGMDFVCSVANIRAHIFGITLKSKFDIKSIAGNIIPAIATTNAIIAGLIVMETLKILSGNISKCKQVYLNRIPNDRKRLLLPCALDPPNPKCYVCSEKHECTVMLNTQKVTVRVLQDKILKGHLNMIAPDVEIDDGKGTIILSSEEGETEENYDKVLSVFAVGQSSRLKCDDFLQNYSLTINIVHVEKLEEEKEFEVVGDISQFHPTETTTESPVEGHTNGASKSKATEEEDDLLIVEDQVTPDLVSTGRKRPAEDQQDALLIKRKKQESNTEDNEDVIEIS
ncbi:SUMO-activating enzyme subunit 2 [Biomphalaria glabrata]|uniref:SUMO-activating enzyme subunit n=1 Tax=Biomphalaria glabrata TaxID=6526 RepID=A0A9U8DUZ7_BIOGL|nr:SUMO-activating enzyme subunit 2-like [Biomphalaria glabrata]KAI8763863.1 SUMO-activating enzyme subunit 2-like [Biomphalaria glabrata]